jgi:hypothetical protein
MLDDSREHHIARFKTEPVGEVVDRLGRVAADDGDIVAVRRPTGEGEGRGAGLFVRVCCLA